jgi:hypothetical protein
VVDGDSRFMEESSLSKFSWMAYCCHTIPRYIIWLWLMMRWNRIILVFWSFGRGYELRLDNCTGWGPHFLASIRQHIDHDGDLET